MTSFTQMERLSSLMVNFTIGITFAALQKRRGETLKQNGKLFSKRKNKTIRIQMLLK